MQRPAAVNNLRKRWRIACAKRRGISQEVELSFDWCCLFDRIRAEVSSELRAHQQLVSVLAPSLQSMEADSAPLLFNSGCFSVKG